MFISVVIPLFNKQEYILRTIKSVLNQSYENFELIIVDDGSTDESMDLAISISDPRVRLFAQANGGVSRARNEGVRQANAEWVAFLDADDEYEPDFLKTVVGFLREHKQHDLSMVGANYYIGEHSRIALDTTIESGIYDYFKLFEKQRSPNNSSTTVVNKKKFIEVKGFPEGVKQFEDWITWFKLAIVGEFGFISTPLGMYHSAEGSVSQSTRAAIDFYRDAILVPLIMDEYMGKHPVPLSKKQNIVICRNEFLVNIAGMLAHDGKKRLALKTLKFASPGFVFGRRVGRLKFLLLHLATPQWIKWIYWQR